MSQDNNSHFSIILAAAMQNREFTQSDLAKNAETSQSNISRYLSGNGMPRAEELQRIARALGVSMEYLLTGDNNPDLPTHPAPALNKKAILKAIEDHRRSLDNLQKQLEG